MMTRDEVEILVKYLFWDAQRYFSHLEYRSPLDVAYKNNIHNDLTTRDKCDTAISFLDASGKLF